jgi:hypothetical protein
MATPLESTRRAQGRRAPAVTTETTGKASAAAAPNARKLSGYF